MQVRHSNQVEFSQNSEDEVSDTPRSMGATKLIAEEA